MRGHGHIGTGRPMAAQQIVEVDGIRQRRRIGDDKGVWERGGREISRTKRGISQAARGATRHRVLQVCVGHALGHVPVQRVAEFPGVAVPADGHARDLGVPQPRQGVRDQGLVRDRHEGAREQLVECGILPAVPAREDDTLN
jgi:hypothetical protein